MTGELIGGAPAQVFVVEVAGPSAFRPGQHVGVTLDAARVHLFDAETGKRFGVSP
jgi:hypothetical protein